MDSPDVGNEVIPIEDVVIKLGCQEYWSKNQTIRKKFKNLKFIKFVRIMEADKWKHLKFPISNLALTYRCIVSEFIISGTPFYVAKLHSFSISTKLMMAWLSLRPELIETYRKYAWTGMLEGTALWKGVILWDEPSN